MKRAMIFFTVVLVIAELNAQQKGVTVFESGMEGHKSYRIPAIISLPNGDILAFAEGRKNNASDFGDINIVQKRSKDKGKTWTELQTIVDYAALQAGNPAPVVDLAINSKCRIKHIYFCSVQKALPDKYLAAY